MISFKKGVALAAGMLMCAGMTYAVASTQASDVVVTGLSGQQLDLKTKISILVREKEEALSKGDMALAEQKQIEIDKLLRQAAIDGLTDIELNAVLLAVQEERSSDRATFATDGAGDWRGATSTGAQPNDPGNGYRGPGEGDQPETPGSGYREA
ncbi:hypothetical protein [Asticcacaulis tiandongensis]|uniref:hypothetical protein n=1 Tax=Asticcacaulis tiandongensis TaxID=2565365 RepID=UPI0011291F6C|nr:hypothetical protein [Asticcacaulis tiandongensis]